MKNEKPNAPALLTPDVIAVAEKRVKESPRGAPITLPADAEITPLMEDAINAPEPAPAITEGPKCVLDVCPKNSVLTVLQWPGEAMKPVVQTPAGEMPVPKGDLAWKLPLLAEIRKKAEGVYVARQLEEVIGHEPLVCSTAVECCVQFKRHFHGERE